MDQANWLNLYETGLLFLHIKNGSKNFYDFFRPIPTHTEGPRIFKKNVIALIPGYPIPITNCRTADIYLLRSRVIRLLNRMESWQRFFHNKRKQNIQDEMFCPWPSNNSESKSNFMNSDLEMYLSVIYLIMQLLIFFGFIATL